LPDAASAAAEVQQVVQQAPRLFGLARSRWWLDGIRQAVAWLGRCSLSGIHRLLRRLGVVYKRGRRHVHSPDLAYRQKVAVIQRLVGLAGRYPARCRVLYQDELTYYRKPTVGYDYAGRGTDRPHAEQGTGSNTKRRIASSLDVQTGVTHSWQRDKFDRRTLLAYLRHVGEQYPQAWRVYIIVDNWPVHFHAEVLNGLMGSRVRLVGLPTYAPWLNPVEKLWRWLYQEILHQHELVGQWARLQEEVQAWLDRWTEPSPALLRYTGLHPD